MSPLESIVILLLLRICSSQINQYEQVIGMNGENIWRSTSDFIPQQSQSFGTIKIGREMSMEFDFIWWGRSLDPRGTADYELGENYYENFFRIGCNATMSASDNDVDYYPCIGGDHTCDGRATRYPSFWITPPRANGLTFMHISVSHGHACQPNHEFTNFGPITIGTSYHVKIFFNDSMLIVTAKENNKTAIPIMQIWSRFPTLSYFIGVDMPVWWMSNQYVSGIYDIYNRGNGTFSNITIISRGFPTISPTMDPTPLSLYYPTQQPIVYRTMEPSMEPTLDPTINKPVYFWTELPSITPTQFPSTTMTISSPSDEKYLENSHLKMLLIGGMVVIAILIIICIGCVRNHYKVSMEHKVWRQSDNLAVINKDPSLQNLNSNSIGNGEITQNSDDGNERKQNDIDDIESAEYALEGMNNDENINMIEYEERDTMRDDALPLNTVNARPKATSNVVTMDQGDV